MPASISKIRKQSESFTLKYAGETVTVEYDPSAYTPKFVEEMSEGWLYIPITKIVKKWDLMEEDAGGNETMYPLTEKALRELPIPFLRALWNRIQEELSPNPPKRQDS